MLLELKNFWLNPLFRNKKDKFWKVIQEIIRWPYFIEDILKNFKNAKQDGIDDLDINAIDYDYTRQNEFKRNDYKSADALIINSDDKLFFIEFKQITNSVNIENFIEWLKFKRKVKDSFITLNNIISSSDFNYKWKSEEFDKVEKKFIFSIKSEKIDPRLESLLTMETFWLDNRFEDNLKVFWVEKKDLEKYL